MPQIPVYQGRQILDDRPVTADYDVRSAGEMGGAIGRLGQVAAGAVEEFAKQRVKVEAETYVSEQTQRSLMEYQEQSEQAAVNAPDGYRGYGAGQAGWLDTRYRELQDKAPSNVAKALIQERMAPLFTRQSMEAHAYERTKFIDYSKQSVEMQAENGGNFLVKRPSKIILDDLQKNFGDQIKALTGSAFNQADAAKIREAGLERLQIAYVQGLDGQGRYTEAINALQGGADSTSTGMAAYREKIESIDYQVREGLLEKAEGQKQKAEAGSLRKAALAKLRAGETGNDLVLPGMSVSSDWTKSISPEKRAALLEDLYRKRKITGASVASSLSNRVANMGAVLREYGSPDPRKQPKEAAEFTKLFEDIDSTVDDGHHSEYEAAGQKAFIIASSTVGDESKRWALRPTSELVRAGEYTYKKIQGRVKNIASQYSDPDIQSESFNGQMNVQIKNSIEAATSELITRRNSDPVGFILQNESNLARENARLPNMNPVQAQAHLSKLIAMQKRLEIPPGSQALLSDGVAKDLTSRLSAKDPVKVERELAYMQKTYGVANTSRMLTELKTKQGLQETFGHLLTVDPDNAPARQAIMNSKLRSAEFNEEIKKNPALEKQLDQEVTKQLQETANALISNDELGKGAGYYNEIQRAITTEAYLNQKRGMSMSDAVTAAKRRVFDSQTTIIKGANGSTVVAPNRVGTRNLSTTLLQAFMDSHLRADGLQALGVAKPEKWQDDARWLNDLSKNGVWRTAEDGQSIQLEYVDPSTKKRMPVLLNGNQPAKYYFEDIQKRINTDTFMKKELN